MNLTDYYHPIQLDLRGRELNGVKHNASNFHRNGFILSKFRQIICAILDISLTLTFFSNYVKTNHMAMLG